MPARWNYLHSFERSYQFTQLTRIRKVCGLGCTFGYIFGLPARSLKACWKLLTSTIPIDSQRIVPLLLAFLREVSGGRRETTCEYFIEGLSYDSSCPSSTRMDVSIYCRRTALYSSDITLTLASCRTPDVCLIALYHRRNGSARSNHLAQYPHQWTQDSHESGS